MFLYEVELNWGQGKFYFIVIIIIIIKSINNNHVPKAFRQKRVMEKYRMKASHGWDKSEKNSMEIPSLHALFIQLCLFPTYSFISLVSNFK